MMVVESRKVSYGISSKHITWCFPRFGCLPHHLCNPQLQNCIYLRVFVYFRIQFWILVSKGICWHNISLKLEASRHEGPNCLILQFHCYFYDVFDMICKYVLHTPTPSILLWVQCYLICDIVHTFLSPKSISMKFILQNTFSSLFLSFYSVVAHQLIISLSVSTKNSPFQNQSKSNPKWIQNQSKN